MNDEQLSIVLESHTKWLRSKTMAGVRADFTKFLGDEFWTYDNRHIIIAETGFNLDKSILNNHDLREANLANISLQGASLAGTQLQNANLQNANLSGITAVNTNFENANLDSASLEGVDLQLSKIQGASLKNTNLQGACLDGLDLSKMDFQGANFTGASLVNTNLNGAILNGAILNNCSMQGANLEHANLSGAFLVNTKFGSAKMQDAILRMAHIEGTEFILAELDGVSFQRAELCKVRFNSASLVTANFRGAKLKGVNFSSKVDCRTTVLQYAKFDDAEELEFITEVNPVTKQTVTREEKKVFFTEIQDIVWGDADVTSITISDDSISKLPLSVLDTYKDTFNNFALRNNSIIRSIEFPKGYEQAGLAVLSYFGKVVRDKYTDINVKVSIKQDGHRITMVIESPEGTKEIIEETLKNYGLVITGQLKPELFLDDKLQILELKQQLTFAKAQHEATRQLMDFKDAHYQSDRAYTLEILKATQSTPPPQFTFNPSLNIETNSSSEKNSMTEQRHINTGGGHYIESNDGAIHIRGNYFNISNNINSAAHDIQALVEQFKTAGMSSEQAQEHVAKDLSSQAKCNQTLKGKLLHWSKELAGSTVSEVAKNVVIAAVRLTGIPLP